MDSYDILVIILSVTLAVFLVMAIVFMSYLIKISREISEITEKAGKVVNNIEAVSTAAASKGAGSFIASIISTVVEKSMNGGGKGDSNGRSGE